MLGVSHFCPEDGRNNHFQNIDSYQQRYILLHALRHEDLISLQLLHGNEWGLQPERE
jgi:hypothetical protein